MVQEQVEVREVRGVWNRIDVRPNWNETLGMPTDRLCRAERNDVAVRQAGS
jgi:hypothetical protein